MKNTWKNIFAFTAGLTLFFLIAAVSIPNAPYQKFRDGLAADSFYKIDGGFAFYATDVAAVTNATSANTANTIVKRGASGEFSAGQITANITGNVSGSSGSCTGNAATATNATTVTDGIYSTGNYSDPSWLTISSAKIGLSAVANALQLYRNGSDFAGIVQGAIFYYDGAIWGFLPPGDSGKFLKTQGASANPIWDSPTGSGDVIAPASHSASYFPRWNTSANSKTLVEGVAGAEIATPSTVVLRDVNASITAQAFYGDGSHLTGVSASLPSQAGNDGKYLKTDGSAVSWSVVTGGGDVTGISSSFANRLMVFGDTSGKLLAQAQLYDSDITIAPASTTENNVPIWSSVSKTLTDGLSAVTTATANALVKRDASASIYAQAFYGDASHLTGNISGSSGSCTGNTAGTAATVTGGTQASITTCANLVSVGTITTGTWNATDIAVADGGTGRSTGTTAYSLIATGTTATGAQQTLANGATTEILVGGGAAALPAWTTATGSGAPVRATSPTLVTPVLGTPSSGTLTNCTFPTLNQNTSGSAASCTGNSATATKLAATKTINGVAFDGSGNITVPSDISPGTSGNVLTSNGSLWTSVASYSYTHPSGDGNLHVPANSTSNSGKVLTAGASAGTYTWQTPTVYETSGAVATHASLQTGIHGISVTSGKTLTAQKTITLTSADDTSVITLPAGTKTLVATDGNISGSSGSCTGNTAGTAATVTGATQSSITTCSNLVSVGTITTGTWNGTDIAVADGGTGRSTGTTAYSLIATGTTATGAQQTLANGATTEILVGGGASALPVWTTATGSGAPVRATSPTLVTPALGTPASGTLTNCTFPTLNQDTSGTAAKATNLAGGAGGQIHYQSAANTTSLLANGTAGAILRAGGTTVAPSWSTPTFPNTATAQKVLIGDGNNIVLSTPNYPTTAGTSGNVMTSDGSHWISSAATLPSRWTEVTGFTATPASTSTLTFGTNKTAVLKVGLPVRYTIASTIYYGKITASASNLLTIAGAPMGGDVTKLEYGVPEQVVVVNFFVSGNYGDGVADLLATDMNTYFRWQQSKAYLVAFSCTEKIVDTGTEPKVNVKVNSSAVSTNDTSLGVQLTTAGAWVDNSAVAINTTYYDINPNDPVEIACTAAGGTGDAAYLTVQATFVLE